MAAGETYPVTLVYTLQDKAGPGLKGLANSAREAANNTDALGGALGKVMMAAGAFVGIGKAKSAFIDFNAEVENSKISIATVSRMFGKSGSWGAAMTDADALFERYQQAAIQSTATTKDFLGMHQKLAPALTATGVSAAKMEEIVKGATNAAPIFNVDASMMALDIESMLRGNVTSRDRAADTMIKSLGMDRETFNTKVRANAGFAIEVLSKTLSGPAMKEAAAAFEGSFQGALSTLEDMFQILSGKAGQGLFAIITEEIKSWNKWLLANKETVESVRKTVSEGLVSGFKTVKTFVQYIVENKSTLMALGGLFIAFKGAAAGAGALGGMVQSFSGMGSMAGQVQTSFGGIVSASANVASGLAALYVGAQALAAYFDNWHKGSVEKDRTLHDVNMAIKSALGGSKSGQAEVLGIARRAGAVTAGGGLDTMKMAEYFRSKGGESSPAVLLQEVDMVARVFKRMGKDQIAPMTFDPDVIERKQSDGKLKTPPTVHIQIARVQVDSSDPDRFVMGLVEIGKRALSRPTQALSAPRI